MSTNYPINGHNDDSHSSGNSIEDIRVDMLRSGRNLICRAIILDNMFDNLIELAGNNNDSPLV
jgi:hypothetical protein